MPHLVKHVLASCLERIDGIPQTVQHLPPLRHGASKPIIKIVSTAR